LKKLLEVSCLYSQVVDNIEDQ